jgi:hypothetical protein
VSSTNGNDSALQGMSPLGESLLVSRSSPEQQTSLVAATPAVTHSTVLLDLSSSPPSGERSSPLAVRDVMQPVDAPPVNTPPPVVVAAANRAPPPARPSPTLRADGKGPKRAVTGAFAGGAAGSPFSRGASGGFPPRGAAKGTAGQPSSAVRGGIIQPERGALSPSGAAAVLDLLSPGGSLGKSGARGRDVAETASQPTPLVALPYRNEESVAAPRPCAPPSRPVPRLHELPAFAAARARKIAAGPPASPRAALVRAVEAAAAGGAFAIPPGVTAVFVPADALPNARPDTPAGDLIAYLIPNEDVAAARALLGDGGAAGDGDGDGEDARERSFILSSTSAELINELDAFLDSDTLHERWKALHEVYKGRK